MKLEELEEKLAYWIGRRAGEPRPAATLAGLPGLTESSDALMPIRLPDLKFDKKE